MQNDARSFSEFHAKKESNPTVLLFLLEAKVHAQPYCFFAIFPSRKMQENFPKNRILRGRFGNFP